MNTNIQVTPEGIWVVEGDTLSSEYIRCQGRLDVERAYIERFRPYVPEGGVVADIGACLGDHTATYSEFVGPRGQVHAFEPEGVALTCLRRNMERYPNVKVHGVALGRWNEPAALSYDGLNLGSGHLTPDTSGLVDVVNLDAVAQDWPRLDFVKIDVEGYEPWVLEGAVETLSRLRPVLLIEINQTTLGWLGLKPEDVYEWLTVLGYEFTPTTRPLDDILALP